MLLGGKFISTPIIPTLSPFNLNILNLKTDLDNKYDINYYMFSYPEQKVDF
jgi:hypothetical protein